MRYRQFVNDTLEIDDGKETRSDGSARNETECDDTKKRGSVGYEHSQLKEFKEEDVERPPFGGVASPWPRGLSGYITRRLQASSRLKTPMLPISEFHFAFCGIATVAATLGYACARRTALSSKA